MAINQYCDLLIRAIDCRRFYRQFGSLGSVNLLNTSVEYKSLGQEFVLKYQQVMQQNPTLTEDQVFDETVTAMRVKGMLPSSSGRGERVVDKSKWEKTPQSTVDLSQIME